MGNFISCIAARLGTLLRGRATVGYAQDYRAPVGTVINAERIEVHQDLGIPLGLSGRVSQRIQLVPTFIDRSDQLSDLAGRFKQSPGAIPGPLLVVIPGCDADLHQGFVLRCALKEFREQYAGETSWRYLARLPWPEGATDVGEVLRTIADALGQPRSAGRQEVERYLADHPRHLCFSHFVDGEDWASDNGTLVRAWCEYFANSALCSGARRLIVAFLCVQLAPERTAACRALEAFIEDVRARHTAATSNILVTNPLRQIRKKHLADWTGEAVRYLEEEYLEGSLMELPSRIFGDDQPQSLYFRDVYMAVRRELERLPIDQRPRFAAERAP